MRTSVFLAAAAALAVLAGCVSTNARDIAIEYYNLGNAYSGLGQYDKAVTMYQSAIRMDPTQDKARYNLAIALIQLKKPADAEGICDELLARDPKNTSVMALRGWALHTQGKEEDALAQYNAILEISPENQDAMYNASIITWKLGRKEEALTGLQTLLAIAPDDLNALYGAGSLLLESDRAEKAREYLDRYLQKKPDDPDAQLLLADCYERLQKYSPALDAYDRASTLDAKDPRGWFGKARLLLTVIEDPAKGVSALKQALQLGFTDMEAIKALLASPILQARDQVEAALKERNMLPQEEHAAPAPSPSEAPPAAPAQ